MTLSLVTSRPTPTFEKAQRLLAENRLHAVSHVHGHSWMGKVLGDHGSYQVAVSTDSVFPIALCDCPHPDPGCSHVEAAMSLLIIEQETEPAC